jgi:hypothetical protein
VPEFAGTQTDPIHRARHRSREKARNAAAHFGQFLNAAGNRLWCKASPVVEQGAPGGDKVALLESMSKRPAEMPSMTLTVAHISPIISVIAGLLILIMPRLLNLIVAIFLIVNGLIGLGLLRWLHI